MNKNSERAELGFQVGRKGSLEGVCLFVCLFVTESRVAQDLELLILLPVNSQRPGLSVVPQLQKKIKVSLGCVKPCLKRVVPGELRGRVYLLSPKHFSDIKLKS